MEKNLYIDASHPNEIRVVVKSDKHIEDYEHESKKSDLIKNNIYLGKISRIEPSLQAAFIDFGRDKHGFLPFNDIQPDYYQLPQSDIQNIKNEDERIREELKEESKKLEENNIDEINNVDSQNEIINTTEELTVNVTNTEENNVINANEKSLNHFNDKKFNNRKKNFGSKRYKIQEILKPNQVILVQVLKDERGQKGAALTTFISIAGKYIVLMPNTPKGGGISRKISNFVERKKIRQILNTITIPNAMGLIVRTAGSNKTKNEIAHDLENLIRSWEEIKQSAVNSFAPALVHEESDIIKRTIRDIYDEEMKNIIIEGNEAYKKAKKFMKLIMPKNVKYIKKYMGKIPLFYKENIESKLNQIYDSSIKLESGGYLVINPTEALVSIDINSGRATKEVNIERTALATNLEAAEEISRQIKIRDLSGLIIIDFIDMINFNNRRTVERRLKEKLKNDRARVQIGRITNFGLMEMSRQRLRESSIKWEINLSIDSFSSKIIKLAEEQAIMNKAKLINISVCEKVNKFISNKYKDEIKYCEEKYKIKIELLTDNALIVPEYNIKLMNKSKKIIKILKYRIDEKSSQDNSKINKKSLNNDKFNKKKFSKSFKKFNYKKKNKFIKKQISN